MNSKPLSRSEKIDLLKGLQTGEKNINDILGPRLMIVSYRDTEPGKIFINDSRQPITPEEAEQLITRKDSKLTIWIECKKYNDDGVEWWLDERYKSLSIFK